MLMLMPPDGFRYVSGTPKTFARSDLERPVTREFCGTRGHACACARDSKRKAVERSPSV